MALLAVVLAALVGGFTTAIRAEVDQTARANDRESAREALERMRKDIHCASGAEAQPTLDALGNPRGPATPSSCRPPRVSASASRTRATASSGARCPSGVARPAIRSFARPRATATRPTRSSRSTTSRATGRSQAATSGRSRPAPRAGCRPSPSACPSTRPREAARRDLRSRRHDRHAQRAGLSISTPILLGPGLGRARAGESERRQAAASSAASSPSLDTVAAPTHRSAAP